MWYMRETLKVTSSSCRSGVEFLVTTSHDTRATIIAYWLIPSGRDYRGFQTIVNDLAGEYHAPVFEPHVTFHVGADHSDAAIHALANVARRRASIALTPSRIGQSEQFTKTLFVEFPLSRELRQLNELMRNAAHDTSQYQLKPHLSLLYKKLPTEARRHLAACIKVSAREVTFDMIKAVRCISPTQSRADVEAWRVIGAASLRDR